MSWLRLLIRLRTDVVDFDWNDEQFAYEQEFEAFKLGVLIQEMREKQNLTQKINYI